MSVYRRGKTWWYRFTWRGDDIRRSTKQTNKRTAAQIEAAHRTPLATRAGGLVDPPRTPTPPAAS